MSFDTHDVVGEKGGGGRGLHTFLSSAKFVILVNMIYILTNLCSKVGKTGIINISNRICIKFLVNLEGHTVIRILSRIHIMYVLYNPRKLKN